jgi:opine dehydrogenase
MKKITVLGGGGTGCMMAADNALRGNEVRLWDSGEYAENLEHIEKMNGITLTGRHTTGTAKLAMVTTNLGEALEGAEVVLIATLVKRHEKICEALAPMLRDKQTVVFSAGNGSSLILKRNIGTRRDVVTGEMSGNVIPCRITGPAEVLCALPYKPKKAAAFPARDTPRMIDALSGVYELTPCRDVLESLLNSPNLIIHLAGCILNAGTIDQSGDFRLYRDGLSEHVIGIMEKIEEEKQRVMEKLGYTSVSHTPFMRQLMDKAHFPGFDDFRNLEGPSGLDHRYVTEDALFGQSIFRALAKTLGLPVPCSEALMFLAGLMNHRDYLNEGKTLDYLGLGGMGKDALLEYLQKGP